MNSFLIKLAMIISCILAIIGQYNVNSAAVHNEKSQIEHKIEQSQSDVENDQQQDEKNFLISKILLNNPKLLMKLIQLEMNNENQIDSDEESLNLSNQFQNDEDLENNNADEDNLNANVNENSENKSLDSTKNNEKYYSRSRRRISVFKNIYHQCRIQKRKEKNLCLYLANLYQNVKGFHGI